MKPGIAIKQGFLGRRPAAPLVLAAALLHGCGTADPSPPPPPDLPVEYSGCAGARRGPTCVLTEKDPVILWIPGTPDQVTVRIDGEETALEAPIPVQNGFRVDLNVPHGTRVVEVYRPEDGARRRLLIAEPEHPPLLRQAEELLMARSFEEAEAMAEQALEAARNDGERGRATAGRASALLGQMSLWRGETSRGRELLRQSLPLLRGAGELEAEHDKTTILVYALMTRDFDFTEARELLEGLPRDWQAPGSVRYLDAYYRGLLAMMTGDARQALEHLEEAVRIAERTGSSPFQRAAEEMVAVQLRRIGRYEEAAAAFSDLHDQAMHEDDPCRRAGVLGNMGLSALRAEEAGIGRTDPRIPLRRALELLEQQCPDDRPERQNAFLNLALAELEAGDPASARDALDRSAGVEAELGVRLLLSRREAEGRLALAAGRPREALSIFESLRRSADAALAPDVRRRAWVGVAMARRALGDPEGALEAFHESERRLDAELLLVPLQEGRESFLAQWQRSTAHHLDLLLALGRVEEALDLARRTRIRLLRHLNRPIRLRGLDPEKKAQWERLVAQYQEERAVIDRMAANDWQLAAEALEAIRAERAETRERLGETLDAAWALLADDVPAVADPETADLPSPTTRPGAVALVFQPLPEGWAVFTHRDGETRAHAPACDPEDPRDPEDLPRLAACLLEAVAPRLENASEIRILDAGALSRIDFQAVPFAGDVLLARAPIVYDLDLSTGDPGNARPGSALVVADPVGDLPNARKEAEQVRQYLRSVARVDALHGRDASADALGAALPEAQLFHFAGHARFRGRGGWQSYLPLSSGGRLTLEDVLLMDRPPRWVVLSGCDTARTDAQRATAQNVGLAQAFLAAGTETVVAAVRPVSDRLAADLIDSFYPAWLAGETPAAALQKAQLDLRQSRPESDWASFRILER